MISATRALPTDQPTTLQAPPLARTFNGSGRDGERLSKWTVPRPIKLLVLTDFNRIQPWDSQPSHTKESCVHKDEDSSSDTKSLYILLASASIRMRENSTELTLWF